MRDRHRNLQRGEDRHQPDDVLAGEKELEVPAEGRDAGGELGDLADPYRHAALVVEVEPHAAHACRIERGELFFAHTHVERDDAARPPWRLRIERPHGIEDRRIVGAIDRGLREHHAVDAERGVQALEIGERRVRRVVSAARGKCVTRLEHMDVRVDGSAGQCEAGPARVPVGRQAISDFAHCARSCYRRTAGRPVAAELALSHLARPGRAFAVRGNRFLEVFVFFAGNEADPPQGGELLLRFLHVVRKEISLAQVFVRAAMARVELERATVVPESGIELTGLRSSCKSALFRRSMALFQSFASTAFFPAA